VSPPPPVTTILKVSHPSQIKLGIPNSSNGNKAQGCIFLTSCELYISLTGSDFPDNQVHIHWALSYFKSGCAVTFAEHVVRQEMKSGQMTFVDWNVFTSEFVSTLCPENEVMTVLM
jgi:hypothetical protein